MGPYIPRQRTELDNMVHSSTGVVNGRFTCTCGFRTTYSLSLGHSAMQVLDEFFTHRREYE